MTDRVDRDVRYWLTPAGWAATNHQHEQPQDDHDEETTTA